MRSWLVLVVVGLSCSSPKGVVDAGAAVTQAVVVPQTKSESLEVTLLPAEPLVAGQPLTFRQRVKNATAKPQRFCTYHTLFEGLRNDVLDVTGSDGGALDYRGMMAKRAPPGPEDFITLAPGEERTSEPVDVSEGYAFTTGTFTVVFPGGGISELPASASLNVVVK